MTRPLVTVLLPVHNGEHYLAEAVESVLSQTFKNYELLVVNDASTDASRDILARYQDSRIRIIDNHRVCGIAESLNKGLRAARGTYAARMDADDVSLPERLQAQVAYFRDNPHVDLLGTWAEAIDVKGNRLRLLRPPFRQAELNWHMLFGNPIVHSSVMFSTKRILDWGGYRCEAAAEDYDLWSRVLRHGSLAVLPAILVKWREHSEGFNTRHFQQRTASAIQSARGNVAASLHIELNPLQAQQIYWIAKRFPLHYTEEFQQHATLLVQLRDAAVKKWSLSIGEKKAIDRDCSSMLLFLASKLSEWKRTAALRPACKALKLSNPLDSADSYARLLVKMALGPKGIAVLRQARKKKEGASPTGK